MKAWYFFGFLLLAMAFFGVRARFGRAGETSAIERAAYLNIQAFELKAMLSQAQPPVVLDVREPSEYAEGHIPNAVLLPLGTLEKDPPKLPKENPVVTVCRSGRRSAIAADILTRAGFTKVYNLSGGMLAWPYETVR